MKKLVFVLPGIAGGGAERVVLTLYRAMETYCSYECHIISLSRRVSHHIDPDLRIHFLEEVSRISKKGLKRLTYRGKAVRIIDDYIENAIGSDCIVLSNMMFSDKIMSLSRHHVYHLIHSSYTQSILGHRSFYERYFAKMNINNVYRNHPLIFVSQGAYESFCKSFRSEAEKHVIYNPINDHEIQAKAEAETPDLASDYIIHVGRFNRAKRHDRLIEAFSRVRSHTKLVLLGEGGLESSVRALAEKKGLTDRVIFHGFRKNPYPYIKNARALVLTSDFEGLPTTIIEAMYLGVPVVSTDCPNGPREIIPRSSPSLVPLDNLDLLSAAIENALINPEKYKLSLDRKFSSAFAAKQYDQLFTAKKECLESFPSTPPMSCPRAF